MNYTNFETVQVVVTGQIAKVYINRPERLNALNATVLDELARVFREIESDEDVTLSILSGRGRCFSAGFDVERSSEAARSGYAKATPLAERANLRSRMNALLTPWDHPKPVIAKVHSYCLAAATLLAVFSDLTVVSTDAVIGLPSLPLGGGFLSPAWVHLVGPKRAKQMSFIAGEQIDGPTAVSWGWANAAVPASELDAYVDDLAQRMSRTPADVLVLKKAAINRMVDATGYRANLLSGAETDALTHQSDGVARIRALIQANGLRQTVKDFASGHVDANRSEREA